MSDTTESSRQATHARQEGVDDNVAALAGPVVGADKPAATDSPQPATAAEPIASAAKKPGGEISARWVAAGMGIGSAALVAALLYANRNNERKRDKR